MKGFIFDIDGLLLDTERISMIAWSKASKEMGIETVVSNNEKFIGLNSVSINKILLEVLTQDEINVFLKRCGIIYWEIMENDGVPVKTGAFELLDYLKEKNFKLAIATSADTDSAMKKLRLSGLIKYFDEIVTGQMVESGKPAPDIFIKASEKLGLTPSDCYAVEDSKNGLISASTAGCKTIMIPDMWQGDEETDKLLFAKLPTLDKIIPII